MVHCTATQLEKNRRSSFRRTGSGVAAARGCWLREAALSGVVAAPHGDPLGRDCEDVGEGVEAGAAARPQADRAPGGLAPIIVVEVPGDVDASTGPAVRFHKKNKEHVLHAGV